MLVAWRSWKSWKSWLPEKSKILENANLLSVFSADLKVILRHLKTELRYFDLLFQYPNDQEKRDHFKILELFEELKNPLKIRKFEFAGKGEHEVMEVLPFLEPQFLKILKIDVGKKNANLELQEIFFLEQWGGVKEVQLIGCITEPWNFEKFEKVEISIQTVTTEQILGFKETPNNDPIQPGHSPSRPPKPTSLLRIPKPLQTSPIPKNQLQRVRMEVLSILPWKQ